MPQQDLHFVVNGAPRTVHVEPTRFLVNVLRDDLGLTGTKVGCGIGVCGACSVLIDGVLGSACLTLAGACEEREITTIEGIAAGPELHPLQRAFLECDALQCGFCTPGQIVAAYALLQERPSPSDAAIAEAMLGNLCRCTGYYPIRTAIRTAADRLARAT